MFKQNSHLGKYLIILGVIFFTMPEKIKMKVWYKMWENSNFITEKEIRWAEQLFSKEIEKYDFQFITTDQFLDYVNSSPDVLKNINNKEHNFDFVELLGH